MTLPDTRIVACAACGGDRGWAFPIGIERTTGALMEEWAECPYCDATGEEEIEVFPVDLADLDEIPAVLA